MGAVEPVLGAGDLAADKLVQANINPDTGLATDYLNHFNEVMMLLEMLPDMPDCAEDVLAWTPLAYEDHFEISGFSDKKLAVDAYRAAPAVLRENLEARVSDINALVLGIQEQLRTAGSPIEVAGEVAEIATHSIKPLIAMAGGIIHGHVEEKATHCEGDAAQAEIDAMFA